MSKTFSVVISTYNSQKWISECLDSLINQTIGFDDNIEVIIVDDASSDNTKIICEEYMNNYPQNIKYLENKTNKGPGISRNIGLKHVTGKYVNFLDSDDTISENTFKDVLDFFDQHDNVDLVSVPIYFFENKKGEHYLNNKFDKTQVVNLVKNPSYYQLSAPSSFIKSSKIKNIKFPDIITSEDVVFVNEILINNPNIGLCCEGRYNYRKRKENSSIINNSQLYKDYYIPRVKYYFKYLIEKSLKKYEYVLEFVQNVIMYDISWMLKIKVTDQILNPSEMKILKSELSDVLKYIDDDILFNYEFLDEKEKINGFLIKYGDYSHPIFSKFKLDTINIDIYDIIDDELYILANIFYFRDNININVYVNNNLIEFNQLVFPQRDEKYLNYIYLKNFTFEFRIPLNKENKFIIEIKNHDKILNINFERPCNFSNVAGYSKTKEYLSKLNGTNISIEHKTTFNWLKTELKTLIKMIKERKVGFKVGIPFRIMYFILYPFLKNKHIWFFMDRPHQADDNGKYLFKYAVDKDENIKKYFIIDKNSPDFDVMSEIGNVIPFKSIKHRILGMFVENIVSSHPDNEVIYPFWGQYPHIAGLLKSNNVFLQHGIIKDDISLWLNKYTMNLAFFLTSAEAEYKSILNNPYNYNENIVKLLGLPRYDSLKNNENKRQIIIMPSWRRILTRKSNDYILTTQYFKIFNSLINNEKLIKFAKENNYEIIFKPHPNVYNFIDLFDKNEYVIIADEKIRYQELFNNGSLLITDYSSVAFDFAYLKKPVLYYHYSQDYHFDLKDSYFNYETMGFGEVIKSEDELVDTIIEYIKNDCKIKKEYLKRIEEFFLYTDKNNCMRVYNAIKNIPLKD